VGTWGQANDDALRNGLGYTMRWDMIEWRGLGYMVDGGDDNQDTEQ